MMRAVRPEPSSPKTNQPLVVPYRRTTPPVVDRQGWTVAEVMLGLLIGLLTTVLGLPLFLMWVYRNTQADTWTIPLLAYAAGVLAMLLGAFSVRRRHQIPGLFPGLSAGIAGGMLILGVVVFYAMHA